MPVSTLHPLTSNFHPDRNSILTALVQGKRAVSHSKNPTDTNANQVAVSFAYDGIKISLPIISIGNDADDMLLQKGIMLIPANASTEEILSTLSTGELEIRGKEDNPSQLTLIFNKSGIKIIRPLTLPSQKDDGTYISDNTMTISPENNLPPYLAVCLTSYELGGNPAATTVRLTLDSTNANEMTAVSRTLADYFATQKDKLPCKPEVRDGAVILSGPIEEISQLFRTLATPKLEKRLCKNAQKALAALESREP